MLFVSNKNTPPSISFNSSILEKKGTWWIAKVKSRHEKAFAFDLIELGVDYYLPYYLKKTKRKDGGTFRESIMVLFPLYVPFICEDPYTFLTHKRVTKILPVQSQQRFKKELNYIFRANESNIPIEPILGTESFKRGEPVEIIAGHLRGAVGTVVNIKNEKSTILLSTDALGCAKVTVDTEMVRPRKLAAGIASLDARVSDESFLMKSIAVQRINKHSIFTKFTISPPGNN